MRKLVMYISICVAIFSLLLNDDVLANSETTLVVSKFIDVPSERLNVHYDDIYKVVAAGIMSGYPDGTFAPNKPLSRVELSAILTTAFGLERNVSLGDFEDVNENYWGYDYIMSAAENGFLYVAGTMFNPLAAVIGSEVRDIFADLGIQLSDNPITRAEMATVMCCYMENVKGTPLLMPNLTDMSMDEMNQLADWGYVHTLLGQYIKDHNKVIVKELASFLLDDVDITYGNYLYYHSVIKDTSNLAIVKCFSEGLLILDQNGKVYPDQQLTCENVYTILERLYEPLTVERPTFAKVAYVPILMYHEINTLPKNGPSGLYVSKENFVKQLDTLLKEGYHTITMDQLWDHWVNQVPLPTKPIVLTFDDGYESHYNFAFLELSKRGMVGTFYIITSFLKEGTIRSPQNLRNMYIEGMEIGSHTVTHLDLRYASHEDIETESRESKRVLSEIIGAQVYNFCYPIGGSTNYAIKILKENGYHTAVKTLYGKANESQGFLTLNRIRIDYYDSIQGYLSKIRFS